MLRLYYLKLFGQYVIILLKTFRTPYFFVLWQLFCIFAVRMKKYSMIMDTLVEKKEEAVENKVTTAENETPEKKMTMWDYVLKFKEKPLIRVLDEDLVFGPNMWTRLMQEEKL